MISVILPIYHNEKALLENLKYTAQIDFDEIILVFDGYKTETDWHEVDPRIKIVEIEKDIPWNTSQARNLGAQKAVSDWLFFLDVDHAIIELKFHDLLQEKIYQIKRINNGKIELAIGSLLMHRETFEKVGQYNTKFDGHYGYEDRYLVDHAKSLGIQFGIATGISMVQNGGVKLPRDKSRNFIMYTKLINGI